MNAPSIVREAISKERAKAYERERALSEANFRVKWAPELDRSWTPNSERKPNYSFFTYIFWGGLITLSMVTGVALGLAVGK